MKTVLALILAAALAPQDKDPDQVKVTADMQNAPLGQVLEMFSQISGVPIELDDAARKQLDLDKEMISIKVQDISVTGALKLLFARHNMDVKTVDKKKVVISPKGS
jgi:hypothetical protein